MAAGHDAHEGHGHGARDDVPAEDPRQLLAQREILQRELQRMERRMAAIEDAMMDAQRAAATVRGLAEVAKQPGRPATHETLVPVGAGVHVAAHIDATADVLLPIGAGYLTKGSPDDVLAALENRIAGINKSFDEASQEAEQLANAAAAIDERLGGAPAE